MQEYVLFIQNHWALSAALLVVFIALILMEFLKIKRGANRLTPQQVINLINHDNGVVVDVRSADAFMNGHIVGSISLPISSLEEKYKKLDKVKSQPLILTCANGQDSARAASILAAKGFQVQLLNGGIRAWLMAEMPLIKD